MVRLRRAVARTSVPAGRAGTAGRASAMAGRALAFVLLAALMAPVLLAPRPAVAASSTGASVSFDVYRPGVYTMQATWTWCTAASVQIMRNILLDQADRSAAHQQAFFSFMRTHNRYQAQAHRGVDPQGFGAGLRQFVDPRYTLASSATFEQAVRSAVTSLRLTGMPVALIVAAGRHAWVLTGFTATADPARTAQFRVLAVRVVGPLYGRQSVNGYDMPPDTSLSYASFARFLLPYRFPFAATPWTGRYLAFEVVPSQLATVRRPLPV